MTEGVTTRNSRGWRSPYPLAVQGVALLALVVAPLSALGLGAAPERLWIMLALCGVQLLGLILVPARRLPLWAQIVYLVLQVLLASTAQALVAAPLLDYVFLAIVLQAMVLFRPWLWIPFAVGVYLVWNGLLIGSGLFPWLRANLALAFPATCAIIAAIVYLRQQRRSEQVQQLLHQMQQRYDALAGGKPELQRRVTLEERSRLVQGVVGEVQGALSRAEQSVASALSQAQTNLARLQSTVTQTRVSAAGAVERLRGAVATLRLGEPDAVLSQSPPPLAALGPSDEAVLSPTPNTVLTWVLPGVFMALALGLTMSTRWPVAPGMLAPLLLCSGLLMLAYVCTQRTRNPLLLQAGLTGQIVAVVVMTVLTQTLPLLLGLLLVLWQLAMRLPLRQMLPYLIGGPAAAAGAVARWSPGALTLNALLVGAVAAVAVGAPLLLARRQLERRKQTELRVALLSAEIEQLLAEVRALAVAGERSRLAREVHDDLGSRLVLINLQLQLAEELAAEDPEAALAQLRESHEQLHAAWRSALAVADAELPIVAEGLRIALAQLAAPTPTPPAVELLLEGELDELAQPLAATIYRVAQEGLTNARKHARAARVQVHVDVRSGYATVTVINNALPGTPPLAPDDQPRASFGLLGLRERAEALGGGLEAGPLADGGWRLRVVLPAESA